MKERTRKTEAMIQYIMFTILVVATPFIVVTRFLQGAVYDFSHLKFSILGAEIPYVGASIVLLFVMILIWKRRQITLRRITAGLVIVGMVAISHWVQDLYGGMSVYDLQKNWHYIAYAAYAFFFFRAFHRRGMPLNKMILYTYFSGLALSSFDEAFQYFLSDRVFDISDISKDSWGAMMGLISVLFIAETYGTIHFKLRDFWKRRLSDYFRDPLTALTICGFLPLIAVMISPMLTDFSHLKIAVTIIITLYVSTLLVIHFLQFKVFRFTFLGVVGLALLLLAGSFVIHRNDQITYNRYGLVVYKGIPVPFFDLLIYPNGLPRLADKKHNFNLQDRRFMLGQKPAILIIGSGYNGEGGNGFSVEEGTYFLFNRYRRKGTQVMILPTARACEEFNRLKAENRNVMFVIHTTC